MWMEMHSRIFACLQTSCSCNCCYNEIKIQPPTTTTTTTTTKFSFQFFFGVFSELNSSGCCCSSYQFEIEIIEL